MPIREQTQSIHLLDRGIPGRMDFNSSFAVMASVGSARPESSSMAALFFESASARRLTPNLTSSLQLHFARQARHRTRGPPSLKKGTATVAFRELRSECRIVASEPDSLIARRIVVFRPNAGYSLASKWQILKEKDYVADGGGFEFSLYFSDHYFSEIASAFCIDI